MVAVLAASAARQRFIPGAHGKQAAVLMGFPTGDEIADEDPAVPRVFHVGGGDTPHELPGVGHFHARALGFHFKRPDAGVRRPAAVVADEEAGGFAFHESDTGMIGQPGWSRGEMRGGRQDDGGLHRVFQLPHFFIHPATWRPVGEADLAMERVHRLVFHFPTGVPALDQIDDPRGISLVGVVVDGERISQRIEGDLLGVAQAGVENLKPTAVRLEAEDRALVRIIVSHAFFRNQTQSAVADGALDPAVRSEREAVQVMAG